MGFKGALEFQGKTKELPFTSERSDRAHRFYSDIFLGIGSNRVACDKANIPDPALKEVSLSFMSPEEGWIPEMSLDYPNMLYAYGRSPGTTTLNFFVGNRGELRTPLDFKDSRVKKRKMKLIHILERLGQIEEEGLSDVRIIWEDVSGQSDANSFRNRRSSMLAYTAGSWRILKQILTLIMTVRSKSLIL